MYQSTESGKAANKAGKRIAKLIAQKLQIGIHSHSNECKYQNKITVIKSARYGNRTFGIYKNMLKHIEQVIIAYQPVKNSTFMLYCVSLDLIEVYGNESKKHFNFTVPKAIEFGHKIGEINIESE